MPFFLVLLSDASAIIHNLFIHLLFDVLIVNPVLNTNAVKEKSSCSSRGSMRKLVAYSSRNKLQFI